MLLLLQTAAQQMPPIHVTVMPMPPSAGMPEWEKTLLSAGVGALLGIISNIGMEYVKPWIAERRLRKTMKKQLGDELMKNLRQAESGERLYSQAAKKDTDEAKSEALTYSLVVAGSMRFDRYQHYFADQKELLYEIDEDQTLSAFYEVCKEGIPGAIRGQRFDDAKRLFYMAATLGSQYVRVHGLPYQRGPTVIDNAVDEIAARRSGGSASENYIA